MATDAHDGVSVASSNSTSASSRPVSKLLRVPLFLWKVVRAIDYVSPPGMSSSQGNMRIRLAKSGAVLIGFMVFHSLPNLLLLTRYHSGYDAYSRELAKTKWVKLVEIFLLLASVVHIGSSLFKYPRKPSQLLSGSAIIILLTLHVMDFKFGVDVSKESLSSKVIELLDAHRSPIKYIQYCAFIATVLIHSLQGVSPSWMSRIGLNEESRVLVPLTRVLVILSIALYTTPLIEGVSR
jgi:succinate dehydrogenase/fumarate reductase cytochrome b subunit